MRAAAAAALFVLWSLPAVHTGAEAPASVPAVSAAPLSVFEATNATDLSGTRWTPDDFRGRVVLIDFWATWCAPCLAELPRLKELRAAYARDELEILGVVLEPSARRTLVSWLNRHRIDWPQIHERQGYAGAVARAFGVRQLPATVLVDHRGALAGRDLRGEALAARIEMLVGSRRDDDPVGRIP